MKQCFKCLLWKPLEDFYKHPMMADGRLGKCKECNKKDVRENWRKIVKDPVRLQKERVRTREKMKRRREAGKQTQQSKAAHEKWAMNNKLKLKAGRLAAQAQKAGKLVKPARCQECRKPAARLEKHHEDYSKPLQVQWLCSACHGRTKWKDVPCP